MQIIEVEKIQRLDVRPGETLVVTLPKTANPKDYESAMDVLKDQMPEGVKLLVVSGDVELSVVARSEESE